MFPICDSCHLEKNLSLSEKIRPVKIQYNVVDHGDQNADAGFFNPDGTHVFLFLVTGSPEMLKKYEAEVQKILNSLKPGK